MTKEVDGCVQPAAGPISEESAPSRGRSLSREEELQVAKERTRERRSAKARVGKPAPDFETPAYVASEGFKNVKLSDYRGQWVVLCFYPGDFTFV